MKKKIIVISILMLSNYSCKCDNNSNNVIKSSKDSYKKISNHKTENFFTGYNVDTFPILTYKKLKRQIKPYDNRLIKDSLLSVFLEDNVLRPIECEGVFYYNIFMFIDSTGIIKSVEFQKDEYKSEELKKNIKIKLLNKKLIPAKKTGESVSIKICVRICLDLYNGQSDINKKLFNKLE